MAPTAAISDRAVSDDERALMAHISMWGSDGYPVVRLGRKWMLDHAAFDNWPAGAALSKTRRDAVRKLERFLGVLREALAGEAYRRAVAERREAV